MAKSLKDALQIAGFKHSKRENARPKFEGKKKINYNKHQMTRSFCDNCEKGYPDVEFYKHRNPTLEAKWLCCECADKFSIPDDVRESNQSDFSKKGTFRRQYGRTKRFSKTEEIDPKNKRERDEEKDRKKAIAQAKADAISNKMKQNDEKKEVDNTPTNKRKWDNKKNIKNNQNKK